MKTLKISREVSIPQDAVTQTMAMIGRKGAGKTYLASMVAEGMLDMDAQVVVLDPVGNWWGLRVGADGKSKGKEIFVIGGDNGDVPLVPEAGARIAQLLVEKNVSAVIDVSSFRLGERKRFAADFGEELLHLKKKVRTAMHLYIEEAQLFIPQRVGPDEARMVGAFEQIVRLGRNYGIGASLITQRPQSVNKEVLSQVECLFVLQITGPHERRALEEWVQEAGADRKLVGELPGLEQGEGYVWSPSWLKVYRRVHFSKKTTFDASSTPVVGKAAKAASLSAVDVKKLREDMAEVVEKAEKDDPKVLRKRIAELEKGGTVAPNVIPGPALVKDIEKKIAAAVRERDVAWRKVVTNANSIIEKLSKRIAALSKESEDLTTEWRPTPPDAAHGSLNEHNIVSAIKSLRAQVPENAAGPTLVVPREAVTGISDPQQRILNAIAWANSIGIERPENSIIAFLSGYTNPRSTGYTNPRGELKGMGLVDYPAPGYVVLTQPGYEASDKPDAIGDEEDLHNRILDRLTGPQSKILRILLAARGETLMNEYIAEHAGYGNPRSTGYTNPRGELRSYGLIEYPSPGAVRAAPFLFL